MNNISNTYVSVLITRKKIMFFDKLQFTDISFW